MTTFSEKLAARWAAADSLLCVGLDPDPARFPPDLAGRSEAIYTFCRAIADATADYACAFKPQIAYFAAHRAEDELEALIAHCRRVHPQIPVVLDAKRGDMGATSEQYAREVFERYGADAVTLQPYQGIDAIAPFLAYPGRGAFVLCRTSNSGGDALQNLDVAGPGGTEKLYERVARLVSGEWNAGGQLGLVVGATYPAELARVRALVGPMPLLVPGIGAQGGDVIATVKAGRTAAGAGLLISSSRAIRYASRGEDYADAAARAAQATRAQIRAALRA
ncbi:MAG: orotidine-5'-phosphate decarboxylase [Betaproteobacteria bacterium]